MAKPKGLDLLMEPHDVDIDDPRALIEASYIPDRSIELETGCYRKKGAVTT